MAGREKAAKEIETQMMREEIANILTQHGQLNFVQRVLHPESSPRLDLGDGKEATHLMTWGEDDDGNYFVYPTVIQDQKTGALKELKPDEAWRYAVENNELIKFPTAEAADRFSKDYKTFWSDQ